MKQFRHNLCSDFIQERQEKKKMLSAHIKKKTASPLQEKNPTTSIIEMKEKINEAPAGVSKTLLFG